MTQKNQDKRIKKAEAKAIQLYERLLRKTAEFDNYRKRIERERVEMVQAAAIELIKELLPIADDFERTLCVEHEGNQKEGSTYHDRNA
jgi:molecular chaperone GrpE